MNNTPSHPASQWHRLIRRCNDASFAFSIGAPYVADDFLRARFKAYAADRETFARELEKHLRQTRELMLVDEGASSARLQGSDWTTLAAAVAANDAGAIVAECQRRDEAVLDACVEVLEDTELHPSARAVVLRHYHAIEEVTAA